MVKHGALSDDLRARTARAQRLTLSALLRLSLSPPRQHRQHEAGRVRPPRAPARPQPQTKGRGVWGVRRELPAGSPTKPDMGATSLLGRRTPRPSCVPGLACIRRMVLWGQPGAGAGPAPSELRDKRQVHPASALTQHRPASFRDLGAQFPARAPAGWGRPPGFPVAPPRPHPPGDRPAAPRTAAAAARRSEFIGWKRTS